MQSGETSAKVILVIMCVSLAFSLPVLYAGWWTVLSLHILGREGGKWRPVANQYVVERTSASHNGTFQIAGDPEI